MNAQKYVAGIEPTADRAEDTRIIATLRHGTGALVTGAVETWQVEHFARKTGEQRANGQARRRNDLSIHVRSHSHTGLGRAARE